ncbi:hypothetical protein VP1G_00237 [Cytospora mali]|uniref:Uncharacterized protein n=1 Tax=Cytospora mali TaxID=578113 RepID=A0A194UMH7_CYTMA|nr:hypothetical protein VP1G_00237 [Valsa mali var. pyri (nom. inval.)]
MASQPSNEKANTPVTTTTIVSNDKLGATTIVTETLSVSPEIDYRRPSEASTPASSHKDPFDTDIEAMISTRTTREDDSCGMKSGSKMNVKGGPDCQVWPGQKHWKNKAKANKINQRSCQCLAKMSKRNRIFAKVGIIILVVAIAVGIGFGISKPLGAGIWKGNGE